MAVRVLIACDHIDHDGALHGGGRQLIELLRALESRPVEATTCVLRAPSALGGSSSERACRCALRHQSQHRREPFHPEQGRDPWPRGEHRNLGHRANRIAEG